MTNQDIPTNWRDIEKKTEILKFDAEKENQIIVCDFLSEGSIETFKSIKFNKLTGREEEKNNISVKFEVEFNSEKYYFTTSASRLIDALQNVAPDLTGKRIKMVKDGTGMNTKYTAILIKPKK